MASQSLSGDRFFSKKKVPQRDAHRFHTRESAAATYSPGAFSTGTAASMAALGMTSMPLRAAVFASAKPSAVRASSSSSSQSNGPIRARPSAIAVRRSVVGQRFVRYACKAYQNTGERRSASSAMISTSTLVYPSRTRNPAPRIASGVEEFGGGVAANPFVFFSFFSMLFPCPEACPRLP